MPDIVHATWPWTSLALNKLLTLITIYRYSWRANISRYYSRRISAAVRTRVLNLSSTRRDWSCWFWARDPAARARASEHPIVVCLLRCRSSAASTEFLRCCTVGSPPSSRSVRARRRPFRLESRRRGDVLLLPFLFLNYSFSSFRSFGCAMSSFLCFGCVDSSQRGVVQQFGKFSHLATPGLNFIIWPCQTISGISVKVQQLDVKTATKTKDNVTV